MTNMVQEKIIEGLKSTNWDFTDNKTTYLTHDIHPYPAKFIPQIPHTLIKNLSFPGELVWDPFGGSGTTALEALLLNRRAISTDSNPLATLIGKAKTTTLHNEDEIELNQWLEKIQILSDDSYAYKEIFKNNKLNLSSFVPDITNIEKWFTEDSIYELAYIRYLKQKLLSTRQKNIIDVAFSKTVLKVSFQDGETRYAKKPKQVKAGETLKCFSRELLSCISKSKKLGHLLNFKEAEFYTLDLRTSCVVNTLNAADFPVIRKNSVDLIVTSPPYPNANDYHLYHRFRIFWLGFNPINLAKIEIGSHLRHQKEKTGFDNYIEEIGKCLINMKEALRPGRYAVLVLGDGIFNGKIFKTSTAIKQQAERMGFTPITTIRRNIHKTKRSFISSARRAKTEDILILQKKSKIIQFCLESPNYKPWPYEEQLRLLEIENRTGQKPHKQNNTLTIKANSLAINKIRTLAFTHAFSFKDYDKESTWQALLENGHENKKGSRRKDSNYLTHGIHPYKGKFYPQLAKSLINIANLTENAILLDPFCGSGTTVLEGSLSGLTSYGCDMNPLAVKIAQSKNSILDVNAYTRDKLFSQILDHLQKQQISIDKEQWLSKYPDYVKKEIISWFPDKVLNQYALIFSEIEQTPNPIIQQFLYTILSGIVRQTSHQDPKDLRIRRRKNLINNAPVIDLFSKNLELMRTRLLAFDNVKNSCPTNIGKTYIWNGDSRDMRCFSGKIQHVDAVITSPPYATALPYIDTDRLSLLLLMGLSSKERRPIEEELTGTREISTNKRKSLEENIEQNNFSEIPSKLARTLISHLYYTNKHSNVGFRRKNQASLLYKYFSDINKVFVNIDRLLKKNGSAFLVLGNSNTSTEKETVTIDTINITKELGRNLHWQLKKEFFISVTKEDMRHVKNSISQNSILWFKKLK